MAVHNTVGGHIESFAPKGAPKEAVSVLAKRLCKDREIPYEHAFSTLPLALIPAVVETIGAIQQYFKGM